MANSGEIADAMEPIYIYIYNKDSNNNNSNNNINKYIINMCKISLRVRKMKVPMVSIYSFPRCLSKQNKMKKWKQPLTIPNT